METSCRGNGMGELGLVTPTPEGGGGGGGVSRNIPF